METLVDKVFDHTYKVETGDHTRMSMLAALLDKAEALKGQAAKLEPSGDGKDAGLDYLKMKMELLLSYCIDFSYYLLMKSEGSKVSDTPAIDQLLLIRGTLERLRPLDSKMKHELDRLIQIVCQADVPEGQRMDMHVNAATDELGLKPNLDALVPKIEGGGVRDESGKAYQAPRVMAMHYEEPIGKSAKEARQDARFRERANRSEVLRTMKSDVLGTPDEVGTTGVAGLDDELHRRLQAKDKEKTDWEEEYMMRRRVTKVDKQKRKRMVARASKLETIGDIGNFQSLKLGRENAPSKKRSSENSTQFTGGNESLMQAGRVMGGASKKKKKKR